VKHGRVLLINPRVCSRRSVRMPLSLLHLGAALEGRYDYRIIDGNLDPNITATVEAELARGGVNLVGVTVMPGPQVATAIQISAAVKACSPATPILWGGYFPTLYTNAALNAHYVDFAARGQGERTLIELLDRLDGWPSDLSTLAEVRGLSCKDNGIPVHNPDRAFHHPDDTPPLPYDRLGCLDPYLRPSFMGSRTAVHQAAIGCRYHCSFCGVVSMFNGVTRLSSAARVALAMRTLRERYGATAMQFYDNNFFDREDTSVPMLDAMAAEPLPWWCYARADTLANFSAATWKLIRQSKLRMAYIGAEAGSDSVLRSMRKGTRVEQTLETAARCREHGVIPEFSFVLGGPDDPEGEIEKTFAFIKRIKRIHPECEVILYFYSPTPQRDSEPVRGDGDSTHLPALASYGPDGPALPTTPEEWTEPRWVNYVCHQDAPWLSDRARGRVRDFARVLSCRFPTAQDYRTPEWGKTVLRCLASWRYRTGRYSRAWELDMARRLIPLREPRRESL
jgi:anaerobic magnesium-protoporphyrin IX monomethyl ester cyclase